MTQKIRIGISACLLGHKVRYDGGHKRDPYLVDTLGRYMDYEPVCPETECGLGIPREPLRLVGDPKAPRLVHVRSGTERTDQMQTWAGGRLQELEEADLCGFIFKSKSPSSGMERVKVYSERGMPHKTGIGIFARMFMAHFPRVPVEEEGRLHDPKLRENFIEAVFVYKAWRELLAQKPQLGDLIAFHTRQKLLIMAHSPEHYRNMGRLVAGGKAVAPQVLWDRYEALLSDALRLKATIRKHTNVLQHVMGYFKKVLTKDEKTELLEIIEQYRTSQLPLIVPITLLNHYVRKYGQEYLAGQTYLRPHPLELQLRNHV